MSSILNQATVTFTHYYNIFTFEYETILEDKIKEYKELWDEIHEILPESLTEKCSQLITHLKKEKITIDEGNQLELTKKYCNSYYEIVDKTLENDLYQDKSGIVRTKIQHTAISELIHKERSCRSLCREFNASSRDFSSAIAECQDTQELVNEAIYIRSVVLGLLAAGLGYAAVQAFKKNKKYQGALLTLAAAVTSCSAVFFVHSSRDFVDFR